MKSKYDDQTAQKAYEIMSETGSTEKVMKNLNISNICFLKWKQGKLPKFYLNNFDSELQEQKMKEFSEAIDKGYKEYLRQYDHFSNFTGVIIINNLGQRNIIISIKCEKCGQEFSVKSELSQKLNFPNTHICEKCGYEENINFCHSDLKRWRKLEHAMIENILYSDSRKAKGKSSSSHSKKRKKKYILKESKYIYIMQEFEKNKESKP